MLKKHAAILLKNTKYSDTDLISKFFAQEDGLISVLSRGVRKPSSKSKTGTIGLYQVLSPCNILIEQKKQADLTYLKELKNNPPLSYFYKTPENTLVAAYMANLILQFVQEGNPDLDLFEFIHHYVNTIESEEVPVKNIPLHFTCNLLQITGYLPRPGFDHSGSAAYQHNDTNTAMASLIDNCLDNTILELNRLEINAQLRKETLNYLVETTAKILQNNKLLLVYQQIKDLMNI